MGLENFVPEIWSAKLFVRLRKALVHASVVNRDYEGEIKEFGDTVRINEIGAVDVSDYTKYTDITWQEMDSAQKVLLIDQADSFAVQLDDIDKAQTKPKLIDGIMSEASYSIVDEVDQYIAAKYTGAGNTVSALTVSVGAVIQNISNLQLKLNEANVPQQDRYLFVPPWYHQHIVNSVSQGINSTGVPKLMDNGVLVNGYVGELFGFNILMSNNVSNNGTIWQMMALHRSAITFAGQIAKIEATRIQDRFGDGIKGLYLYGAKVVRPNAMVTCAATKG